MNSVGMAFHRHAREYDRHAVVQKRVISQLSQLVRNHLSEAPQSILDIGCGTGLLLQQLHRMHPEARLSGLDLAPDMISRSRERLGVDAVLVQGDAESLPFCEGVFDLLVSTSTLQWLDELDTFFHECSRVMSDDSLLCIAFFGGSTLWELRECYRDVIERHGTTHLGLLNRLHNFKSRDDVQMALEKLDFDSVICSSETEIEYHHDVHQLLRSIKNIGAGAKGTGGGGLGWRRILNEISGCYRDKFQSGGVIPATYEVFYVVARKQGRKLSQ